MIDDLINSFKRLDELTKNLIKYITSSESLDDDIYFQNNFSHFFDINKNDMKIILQIISSLCKENEQQNNSIISTIYDLLNFLKPKINENFNESEVFNIFKSKKRLLLYIYENEIIPKQSFYKELVNYYDQTDFLQFFYFELRELNLDEFEYRIQLYKIESMIEENDTNIDLFKERRRKGENENKLLKIIKNDLIDDFTSLVSQSNLNLNSIIETSFFEPIYKEEGELMEPSLIEYAAYYGSQSIFKYLFLNDAKITKNLLWFSIHGRNYDIIHLIENSQIELSYVDLTDCYNEAIKLYYNEIAIYIEESFLKDKISFSSIEICIRSFNIKMLIHILENNEKILENKSYINKFFFYLCECGYTDIVDLLLQKSNYDFLNAIDTKIFY